MVCVRQDVKISYIYDILILVYVDVEYIAYFINGCELIQFAGDQVDWLVSMTFDF